MTRNVIKARSDKKEYRKFIGVLVFIALAATLMSTLISFHVMDWIRWYVGSMLLVFGGCKLISMESFLQVFPRYDPLAAKFGWYSYVYPLVEVMLGTFYILDILPGLRYIITFIIVSFGLVGMVVNLNIQGPSTHNTWLGKTFKLPMSTAILFEDAIVAVLAAILVIGAIV
jgi:hypothetical protein